MKAKPRELMSAATRQEVGEVLEEVLVGRDQRRRGGLRRRRD